MTETAAAVIEELTGLSVYMDYSGRCMYGETTTGIVVDDIEEWHGAIAEVIRHGSQLGEEALEEVAQAIAKAQMDNLGLRYIYY